MRPNRLAFIALTLAITLLTGCSKSSTSTSSTTVVSTFTATDTATVTAPGSAIGSFAFTGAAGAVSGIPSTVTIGLNTSGLPLTAAVTGVVAITASSLTSGTIAYSGNTLFTTTTTGTTNFSGDLYASVVPATPTNPSTGLKYSNFGEWQLLPPPSTTGNFYVQEYAGGTQLTPASGVPATNTINYYGTEAAIGFTGTSPPDEYIISAGGTTVLLNFNFVSNTFSGTIAYISGTRDRWTGAVPVPGDFNSLTLNGTVTGNTFNGTVTPNIDVPLASGPLALPTTVTGTLNGMFYGPAGNEVSGVYQLTSGSVIIIGSFGAKQ